MTGLVNRSFAVIVLLCSFLLLSSCSNSNTVSGGNGETYPFVGKWQGSGVDSEGNEFTFAAKVIALGEHRYRVLVFDELDTQQEPLHVMEGILKGNQFSYTADEGIYVGGGELSDEMFEGYYKGAVDGTYKMRRVSEH
jgi:hypothetical protein